MIWWMHLRHLCTSDTAVARSIVQELETNISRYRLLTKTANLAPLCTVITLAIREVHVLVPSDADFRSRCLHILATVMIAYSVFVSFLVFLLPKGRRIEVDDTCPIKDSVQLGKLWTAWQKDWIRKELSAEQKGIGRDRRASSTLGLFCRWAANSSSWLSGRQA